MVAANGSWTDNLCTDTTNSRPTAFNYGELSLWGPVRPWIIIIHVKLLLILAETRNPVPTPKHLAQSLFHEIKNPDTTQLSRLPRSRHHHQRPGFRRGRSPPPPPPPCYRSREWAQTVWGTAHPCDQPNYPNYIRSISSVLSSSVCAIIDGFHSSILLDLT